MVSNRKKFRVGIDLSAIDPNFREHAHRGTGRYLRNIWDYLQNNPSDVVEFVPFSHRDIARPDSLLERLADKLPRGRQTVKSQFLYPRKFARVPADLLYFPCHLDAPAWCSTPRVVTVLDLIPMVLSHLFGERSKGYRFRFGRWLESSAITNARHIFAISEHTANDCVRVLGVKRERIIITPLGVDKKFFNPVTNDEFAKIRKKLSLSGDDTYVLAVGGIDPRKNLRTLLTSFKNLIERQRFYGVPESKLVMVGKIQVDDQYPLFKSLSASLGLSAHIIETGFISDDELIALYSRAIALFSPTMYEGFGLTLLEAMAGGCPVVCSDNSSIPEAVGTAALMENCFDEVSFGRDLFELCSHTTLREKLTSQGKIRAQSYSWDNAGRLTLKGFEKIAHE